MTGPLTFITAFVASAILSRPKVPELEPDPKVREIAELKEKLRICEAARDAARDDRDHSDGQLRTLRAAYDGLLHMFADEQASRLRLERDYIELEAVLHGGRSNAHRAQAPWHLPLPPAQLPQVHQRAYQQTPEQMRAQQQSLAALSAAALRNPVVAEPIVADMDRLMRSMDAFICNCAPGRHELFVREPPNLNMGDATEGDDTL